MGFTLVDDDGHAVMHDGEPVYGEATMASSGFLYTGTKEEGYLLGSADPWDMSNFENVAAESADADKLLVLV